MSKGTELLIFTRLPRFLAIFGLVSIRVVELFYFVVTELAVFTDRAITNLWAEVTSTSAKSTYL